MLRRPCRRPRRQSSRRPKNKILTPQLEQYTRCGTEECDAVSLKRAVAVSLAVYDRADRVETAREHAVVRCARPAHAPPPPRTPTHDSPSGDPGNR
jgi:hypothetical protein